MFMYSGVRILRLLGFPLVRYLNNFYILDCSLDLTALECSLCILISLLTGLLLGLSSTFLKVGPWFALRGDTDFLCNVLLKLFWLITLGLFSLWLAAGLLTTGLTVRGWCFLIGLTDFLFSTWGVMGVRWMVYLGLFLIVGGSGNYFLTLSMMMPCTFWGNLYSYMS